MVLNKQERKLQPFYQAMPTAELRDRVASGELALQVLSIAESVLLLRAAKAEAPTVNLQEQMLIDLYKNMPSHEIKNRLDGDGLVALARGVAENELQLRSTPENSRGADALSLKSKLVLDELRGTDTVGRRSALAQEARSRGT